MAATLIDILNAQPDGWTSAMGVKFTVATPELVEAEWTVGQQHLQPHGIVHGGVYCGVIEALCSIGATVASASRGEKGKIVGLENHTSFIRSVGAGILLKGRGTPITRGSTTQVWEATVTDPSGAVVATGRVRLLRVT